MMTNHNIFGSDLFGDSVKLERTILGSKFGGVPPFSVLDRKSGEWRERREHWETFGVHEPDLEDRATTFGNKSADNPVDAILSATGSTSRFCPVLCEMLINWFTPFGGSVLDPFAGGAVRGIVTQALGRDYVGVDLRPEQITKNQEQARRVFPTGAQPHWIVADSRTALKETVKVGEYDAALTCPPYGALEVYSDREEDLSNMSDADFQVAHRTIIKETVDALSKDAFLIWVVGEYRTKSGLLQSMVADTIAGFSASGCGLYNHGIILDPAATVGIRVSSHFDKSRKLGMAHQHFLVFAKGDWRKAAAKVQESKWAVTR